MNQLLTAQEVAERLKISTSTVYRLCKQGLPHIKKSYGIRIREEDLNKWIEQDRKVLTIAEGILKNALTNSPPADIDKPKEVTASWLRKAKLASTMDLGVFTAGRQN